MIKEAIEEICRLRKPDQIQVDGKIYYDPNYKPARIWYPQALDTTTLESIVNFVKEAVDGWEPKQLYINVYSHNKAYLYTHTHGKFNQRVCLIEADAITTDFSFGRDYDLETFIIGLHSQFEPTEDRDYLLDLVSKLTAESGKTLSDNGASQEVQVRSGITMKENKKIKNPVTLAPFRSFPEIDQPESEFVFRIKRSGHGGDLFCSLHPCDGSAWRLEAIDSIAGYLMSKLPNVPVIA